MRRIIAAEGATGTAYFLRVTIGLKGEPSTGRGSIARILLPCNSHDR